jgi:ankyrin repeat protein
VRVHELVFSVALFAFAIGPSVASQAQSAGGTVKDFPAEWDRVVSGFGRCTVPTQLSLDPPMGQTKGVTGSISVPLVIGPNRGQFGRSATFTITWDVSDGAGAGVRNHLTGKIDYPSPDAVFLGVKTLQVGQEAIDAEMVHAVKLKFKDAKLSFSVFDAKGYKVAVFTNSVTDWGTPQGSPLNWNSFVNYLKENCVKSGQLDSGSKIEEPIEIGFFSLTGLEYDRMTLNDFLQGYRSNLDQIWTAEDAKKKIAQQEQGSKQAQSLYSEALSDLQSRRFAEARDKANRAAKLDPSLGDKASKIVRDADQAERTANAQRTNPAQNSAQAQQATGTSNTTPPAQGANSAPSTQRNAKNPATATTYSPAPPPPPSQTNYGQQAVATWQRQIQANEEAIDKISESVDEVVRQNEREQENWNRWSAASKLNAMQSPEGMIREAQEKKAELERLTQEREAEFNRKVEELAAESAGKYSGDQATGAAVILGLTAAVGNISLEAQKERAKKDIDAQQTKTFQEIQNKTLASCDENIEAARSDMAVTVFSDEFHYFKALVSYYQNYKRKLVDEFTIADADWLRPDRNPPKEPVFSKNLNMSESELGSFLREKWDFYSSASADLKPTSAGSIQALSQDAIHRHPDFADSFYYLGLFTEDSLDSWLLLEEAKTKAPQRSDIVQSQAKATARLSDELFGAISKGDAAKISRIWTTGVGRDFKNSSGQNPYYAALLANPNSLRALLEASTGQERLWVPQSLMVLSAADGANPVIQILVASGADPLKANEAGITPIVAAADRGHYDTLALLDTSYHVDAVEGLALAHSLKVDSAVYHLQVYDLGKAFVGDDADRARQLVLERADLPIAPLSDKETFLAGCACRDKPAVLKLFLENPDYAQFRDTTGNSLADLAMGANAPDEIFRILAEASALMPAKGLTTLCYAASKGRKELASYLLAQGADPNEKGTGGQTALHAAAKANQCEMVTLLLANQADPMVCNDQGQTSIHVAAQYLDPKNIRAFVNGTATALPADSNGRTPLAVAVQWHRPGAAEALAGTQSDLSARDGHGRSILLQAILTCPEFVPSLLSNTETFNIADNEGDTPLAAAIRLGRRDWVEKLVQGGADLNRADRNGMTPVHWAALSEDPRIRSVLLNDNAGLLLKDKHGRTPIHYLLSRGQNDLVASVVKARRIPGDATDEQGITLLDLAIASRLDDVALELIRNSKDLDIQQNSTGFTALEVAVMADDRSVVTALLRAGANRNLRDWKDKRAQDLAYEAHKNDLGDLIRKWK